MTEPHRPNSLALDEDWVRIEVARCIKDRKGFRRLPSKSVPRIDMHVFYVVFGVDADGSEHVLATSRNTFNAFLLADRHARHWVTPIVDLTS
jgi:hypothetical protein